MFYQVFCEDNYEIINLKDEKNYNYLRLLNGNKQQTWLDFEITFESADALKEKRKSDFPWYMSSVLIIREHVLLNMKRIFEQNGELLPIHSSDNQKLYAFNCNCIDALDEEKSNIVRMKSSGKILLIRNIVLRDEDKIQADIFRLNYPNSPTFVSDNFIRVYNDNNYVGLKFIKLSEIKLK